MDASHVTSNRNAFIGNPRAHIHPRRPSRSGGRVKSEEWSVRDSGAAPIEFMGFVATLLLGLVVVIVVVHIL